MKNAINSYFMHIGREPYQPLSELVAKLKQCSSKYLTSQEDLSDLERPISIISPISTSLHHIKTEAIA